MELIAGRRVYGVFEGNVFYSSEKADTPQRFPCAFVPRGSRGVYTPGLTYLEMLTYAARLKMKDPPAEIVEQRVLYVMEVLNLLYCKDRMIENRPTDRGILGGELRKISIATEIINLTPVIVLDDITLDLETIAAADILKCLAKFAKMGYTIISSMPKSPTQVFNQFDKVVLVNDGITLFASHRENVSRFFCNRPLDYKMTMDKDVCDFLLDIASGVELPVGARRPLSAEEISIQYSQSAYYEPFSRQKTNLLPPVKAPSVTTLVDVLPQTRFPYFGYFNTNKVEQLRLTSVVLERAFFVKIRETTVLAKSLKSMVFVGLLMGYFSLDVGSFGEYSLRLLGMPYAETTNITAILFLFLSVVFATQVLNVHIIGQKIKTFRYEQRSGCCPTFGFWLAFVLSEIPFTIFFALVFTLMEMRFMLSWSTQRSFIA